MKKKKYEHGGKMSPMRKRQFPSNKRRHQVNRIVGEVVRDVGGTREDVNRIADAGKSKLPKSNAPKPKLKTRGMEKGGKVVAQGADKKDVRREKKMDRIMKRKKG